MNTNMKRGTKEKENRNFAFNMLFIILVTSITNHQSICMFLILPKYCLFNKHFVNFRFNQQVHIFVMIFYPGIGTKYVEDKNWEECLFDDKLFLDQPLACFKTGFGKFVLIQGFTQGLPSDPSVWKYLLAKPFWGYTVWDFGHKLSNS